MSLDKIADIADAIGPQTMVSRIGKIPMDIQKTLFGPIKHIKEKKKGVRTIRLSHINQEQDHYHSVFSKKESGLVLPKLNPNQIKTNPYRQRNDSNKLSNEFPASIRDSVASSKINTAQQTLSPYKNLNTANTGQTQFLGVGGLSYFKSVERDKTMLMKHTQSRRYIDTHYFPTFVQIDKNSPAFIFGEQSIHKTKGSQDGSKSPRRIQQSKSPNSPDKNKDLNGKGTIVCARALKSIVGSKVNILNTGDDNPNWQINHTQYENATPLRNSQNLVEMDRMQGRQHSPHLLSLGFLVSKNESPNAQRFDNINKSPTILSNFKRIPSPKLQSFSQRKTDEPTTNCNVFYYDSNIDAIKANPAKATIDISKITSRKTPIYNSSGFQGFIDNERVTQALDMHSLPRQMVGYSEFNKFKGRDWVQKIAASNMLNTKIDFEDYLPNSIKRKRDKKLLHNPDDVNLQLRSKNMSLLQSSITPLI